MEEELLELFEQYHEGRLKSDRKREFQTRLKRDEAFRIEYDNYVRAVTMIEGEGIRLELAGLMNKTPRSSRFKLVRYAAAAAVAGIMLLGYAFWPVSPGEELFAQYFEPYPDIYLSRSIADHEMEDILATYTKGEYRKTLLALNKLAESDAVHFYRGNSYLAMNQSSMALAAFREINDTSVFEGQVAWYKALTFLKQDQLDSALYYLDMIGPEGYRYHDSRKILQQLQWQKTIVSAFIKNQVPWRMY